MAKIQASDRINRISSVSSWYGKLITTGVSPTTRAGSSWIGHLLRRGATVRCSWGGFGRGLRFDSLGHGLQLPTHLLDRNRVVCLAQSLNHAGELVQSSFDCVRTASQFRGSSSSGKESLWHVDIFVQRARCFPPPLNPMVCIFVVLLSGASLFRRNIVGTLRSVLRAITADRMCLACRDVSKYIKI